MHTDTHLTVKTGTIFARTWTPAILANDIPLVLMHDSLGCVDLWREFPEALAERLQCPVFAYDRLGFGQSSARTELPSLNFIREEAEQNLPEILDQVGISKFAILGHSVGGSMALVTASRLPNRCQAVVSISAQAFVEDQTVLGVKAARRLFRNDEQLDRMKKWHGEKAEWVVRAWTETWLSPDFASWSLQADLPRVSCPVLVLHGDLDEYGSQRFPDFICQYAGGPTEKHILTACGHVPHREKPDEVLAIIVQFLGAGRTSSQL